MALTKISGNLIQQPFDVGIITATNINASGIITATTANFTDATISGNLTVQGTTTTLDTVLTEVDKLEVGANNSTVGVAITQSGSGDILRLYDGASQVVTVADGGSVGIGTDNPSAPLHIRSSEDRGILIESTDANAYIVFKDTDTSSDYANRVGTISDGLYFNTGGGGERLRITSSGRLSIGNYSSPKAPLHIRGEYLDQAPVAGVGTGSFVISNSDTNYGINFGVRGSGIGWIQQTRVDGTGTNYSLVLNPLGGNIGIGTDVPSSVLSINSSQPIIKLTDSDNGLSASINASSGNLYYDTATSARDHIFRGSTTEVVRITGDGSVGIGTNDPTETLHVEGNARVTGILTVGQNSTVINGALEYPSIRPTLDLNFAATKVLDDVITFTRDSIGTYTDELGVLKYASNNTPRFDHDPATGESLGLLIEESRTNLLTYSDLTSGEGLSPGWVNAGPVASKGTNVIAPDGTQTAWTTLYDGSSGDGALSRNGGEVATSNSTVYTYSIWAKVPSTNTYITGVRLRTYNDNHSANFNLLTGEVIGGSEGTTTPRIEAYPNDWYRCSITFTSGTDGDQGIQNYMLNNTSGSLNSSGANGEALYLWGAQLEAGAFATSYIPTSGSTVTRAQDLAKITGTNFTDFYNQTEGTIVDSCIFISEVTSSFSGGNPRVYTFSDGSENNNLNKVRTSSITSDRVIVRSGGTAQADLQAAYTSTLSSLVSTSYKVDDFRLQSSNGSVATDNSGAVPSGVTQLTFGTYDVGGFTATRVLNGTIKRFTYYPKRLPNAQLQGLTAQ